MWLAAAHHQYIRCCRVICEGPVSSAADVPLELILRDGHPLCIEVQCRSCVRSSIVEHEQKRNSEQMNVDAVLRRGKHDVVRCLIGARCSTARISTID